MKTYVFDIDGTICSKGSADYLDVVPYKERIQKINKLYEEGNTIVFHTARGMGRTEGNSNHAIRMFFDLTLEQLDSWGVKYHRLMLGKPAGDFYIDDKGMKDEDFFGN
jgi:capsule biosynthesis phosphatase